MIDGRLAGGAYPFKARTQAGKELLDGIVASGVSAFVDLTEAGTGWESFLLDYAPHLEGSDAVVRRHPIPDMGITTPARAAEALDSIDELLDTGRTVYVHCYGGIGRTATILGCWMMRHGYADSESVLGTIDTLRRQDIARRNWRAPQTEEQRQFVVRWRETS